MYVTYKNVLLVYKLKWYLFFSHFLTVPCFLIQITTFLRKNSPSCVFPLSIISLIQASGGCFRMLSMCSVCIVRSVKGGEIKVEQETQEFCAGAHETIMESDLLCQYHTQTQLLVRITVL